MRCGGSANAWCSSSAIPAYYPRFGFEPAGAYGLTSPFPAEAFMVMELVPGALRGIVGPAVPGRLRDLNRDRR